MSFGDFLKVAVGTGIAFAGVGMAAKGLEGMFGGGDDWRSARSYGHHHHGHHHGAFDHHHHGRRHDSDWHPHHEIGRYGGYDRYDMELAREDAYWQGRNDQYMLDRMPFQMMAYSNPWFS